VMREMEAGYGSLFKGAIGRMRAARRAKMSDNGHYSPPRFITFQNGVEELIEGIVARLKGDLLLGVEIERIRPTDELYEISLKDGQRIVADAIIFATPANVTVSLLEDFAPEPAKELAKIRHENIGTISLAYHSKDVRREHPINGLMIPRREK
jgi:protoporphyrinogen oxidase